MPTPARPNTAGAIPLLEVAEHALSLANAGYWLIQFAPHAELIRISESFYGLLGIATETEPSTLQYWLDRCHHEDHAALSECWSLPKTQQTPSAQPSMVRMRNRFGIWTWLEARCLSLPYDHNTRLICFKDVSDFKELQSAASDSQIRYHSLYNSSPLALILWNREGLITGWNNYAESLFGWQEPEVIGKKIHNLLFPSEQTSWFADHIRSLIKQEGDGRFSSHNLTRSGKRLRCEWSNVVLHNARGQLIGVMSLVMDITELWNSKHNEQLLIEAHQLAESAARMKSEFLANMSHELRTPMNAVIGLAHLLEKTKLTPRQHGYVSKISDAGTLLLHVLNDVLDFSKIEAGKMQLEETEFELERTLDNVANMVIQPAQEKGLELHFVIAPEVPDRVRGDGLRLSQILINLLSNAIKFTHTGFVAVFIRCLQSTATHTQLEIAVQDTGIGISEAQLSKLFNAFTQADSSITRQFGGTGLGLTISKRLTELMGGQLTVRSDPGVGSTFISTLWLQNVASTSLSPRIQANVLIVDDQAIARTVLAGLLSKLGVSSTSAHTANDALNIVLQDSAHFDWCFLDWKMPDMLGTDLASQIRQHYQKQGKQTQIVLVTAASPEQLDGAQRSGLVDHVLIKPIFPAQLIGLFNKNTHPTSNPASHTPLKGCHILVTEDIPTNQMIAQDMLESMGAKVSLADHGLAAIEALKANPDTFDLLLMDIQMPVLDGLQATRRIRHEISTSLPIIAMTAHALEEGRESCELAGMNDFLTKPINPTQLEKTLVRWCQHKTENSAKTPLAALTNPNPIEDPADDPLRTIAHWHLPGINIEDGLRRMMNKPALYEKILKDFHQRFHNEIERIAEHLSGNEHETATRCAHSLKGLSGSVSATTLFELAKALEFAIAQNQNIEIALNEAATEHRRVMTGIAEQFSL